VIPCDLAGMPLNVDTHSKSVGMDIGFGLQEETWPI
jgi:hypothetical protein